MAQLENSGQIYLFMRVQLSRTPIAWQTSTAAFFGCRVITGSPVESRCLRPAQRGKEKEKKNTKIATEFSCPWFVIFDITQVDALVL